MERSISSYQEITDHLSKTRTNWREVLPGDFEATLAVLSASCNMDLFEVMIYILIPDRA
ncbi:MAG TPA: hypothetical protein VGA05_04175 [Candidatus Bathyarchaeia archaeon]